MWLVGMSGLHWSFLLERQKYLLIQSQPKTNNCSCLQSSFLDEPTENVKTKIFDKEFHLINYRPISNSVTCNKLDFYLMI